jgi:TetR/AcrR family transcriptional repressor of nem operon
MARPSSFDRSKAVDAALKLFWRRGYLATSLPELLEAMGIARSSFYATIIDKRSLFIECLKLFGERTRKILLTAAQSSENLEAIRHFFDETVTNAPLHRVSCGCMMVNSILELTDVDTELRDLAQAKLDQIQNEFGILLGLAKAEGKLDHALSPDDLAEALMTLNVGVRVQSRKHADRARLKQSIDTTLTAFGIAA